MTILR